MHKVLGKFIEQSGLDRIFVESELYESSTIYSEI